MKLEIIVPAHNEEKRIGNTLEEYGNFFRKKKENGDIEDFEILVILNACKDKTLEVVKKATDKFQEIKYLDFKQGGKGFALTEGFKHSIRKKRDFIGYVDADMATSPDSFYELVKSIKGYDGMIASRGLKDSIVKTSFTRKLTNRGFNFFVRAILQMPYKDTQCGAKLFTREAISGVVNELGNTKWAFDIDLLYKMRKKGFRIKEVKTVWEDMAGSKVNLVKVPIQMFSSIIRLRIMYSPFKFMVDAYDKMPGWIKIHNWKT